MSYGLIGHYVTCDDAECNDCFEEAGGLKQWKKDGGFEGWDEPIPIMQDTESDNPTHCRKCNSLIEHNLTGEGHNYVAERLLEFWRDGTGSAEVLAQWAEHYGDDAAEDISGIVLDTIKEYRRHVTEPLPWWQPEIPPATAAKAETIGYDPIDGYKRGKWEGVRFTINTRNNTITDMTDYGKLGEWAARGAATPHDIGEGVTVYRWAGGWED